MSVLTKIQTIILILIALLTLTNKAQSQTNEFDDSKHSMYISIGTVKSIYYNSPVKNKHYAGVFSLQFGYARKLSEKNKLVFNVGIMRKGPFGECFEYCEFERVFSTPLKIRLESTIFNDRITYGVGAGTTGYVLNLDEKYDDDLNLESEAIYERRLGLGIDLVSYYNLNRKWKIGIHYNPKIFEFKENKIL